MRQNSRDAFTYLGKTLLGLSLIGGGLGLLMDGSLTLVGGLLLRSLNSGLSSVKQIHHIILLLFLLKEDVIIKQLTFIPFVFARPPFSIIEASVFTEKVAMNETLPHSCIWYVKQ